MNRKVRAKLHALSTNEAVPINIRRAVETVIHNQHVFAAANKLPTGTENDALRKRNETNQCERSYFELLAELNAREEDEVDTNPSEEEEEGVVSSGGAETLPAPKRLALTKREIAVAAVHLAELPSEILSLIFDAYARNQPSRFPAISRASKRLLALERARLAKLPNASGDVTANAFSASVINAALVATLSVFLATAYPRASNVFVNHKYQRVGAVEVRDASLHVTGVTWNFATDQARRRRYIALSKEYVTPDWAEPIQPKRRQEFVRLGYEDVADPGYISYDALAAESVLYIYKTPTFDMPWQVNDQGSYYMQVGEGRRIFWRVSDSDSDEELVELEDVVADSGHPDMLPWPTGYDSTTYGRSRRRLISTGIWKPKMLLIHQDFFRYTVEDSPIRVKAWYILKPEPQANWNVERLRLANILECARVADETSEIRAVSAERDAGDPTQYTMRGLRTNAFQATASPKELEFAADDPTMAPHLRDQGGYSGMVSYHPYFMTLSANLTLSRLNDSVFSVGLARETTLAESFWDKFFELVAALGDSDLIADLKACVSVYGYDAETNGTIKTVRGRDKNKHVLVRGPTFDDQGIYKNEKDFKKLKQFRDDAMKRYAKSQPRIGNRCMEYRIVINRTHLHRLLANHELGSVTTAFSKLWHTMTDRLANIDGQSS